MHLRFISDNYSTYHRVAAIGTSRPIFPSGKSQISYNILTQYSLLLTSFIVLQNRKLHMDNSKETYYLL